MNKFFRKLKNIFYSLPFGLKGADTEIMGGGKTSDGSNTVIKQQVSDERVSKHLLKGEITQEVEELRYRTYKVERESDKYNYIGQGIAIKNDSKPENKKVIKFSQENKLICNDILTELKRVNGYGIEKYTVNIDYYFVVRFKMEEFLTLIDVYIKEGEKAVTTLHFSDVMNPSVFTSKPFVIELSKLYDLFNNNDTYGISRNELATSINSLSFTTYNATDKEPNIISYTFAIPELIGVYHENQEYKLIFEWQEYKRIDLTDKFFNQELENKYQKKEKKHINSETEIVDVNDVSVFDRYEKVEKCHMCGKEVNVFSDGFMCDKQGNLICKDCYVNYLLKESD